MKNIDQLINDLTNLTWAKPLFPTSDEVDELMQLFFELNLKLNILSDQKEEYSTLIKNKISSLPWDALASGLEWYIYDTSFWFGSYDPYMGYYQYNQIQIRRSGLEFFIEWFPEIKNDIIDFEEGMKQMDMLCAHAGTDRALSKEIPEGLPPSHWWWFWDKICEKNYDYSRKDPNYWKDCW